MQYSDEYDIADGDSMIMEGLGDVMFRVLFGFVKRRDISNRGGRFVVVVTALGLSAVDAEWFLAGSSQTSSLLPAGGFLPITIGFPFRRAISRIADSEVCCEIGRGCFSGS